MTAKLLVLLLVATTPLSNCIINDSLYTNFLSIPSDVGSLEVFWFLDNAAQRLHLRLRTPLTGASGYVGVGFCDNDIPDAVE
jgi:hypothetical protein